MNNGQESKKWGKHCCQFRVYCLLRHLLGWWISPDVLNTTLHLPINASHSSTICVAKESIHESKSGEMCSKPAISDKYFQVLLTLGFSRPK